jgi:hypothetical protein
LRKVEKPGFFVPKEFSTASNGWLSRKAKEHPVFQMDEYGRNNNYFQILPQEKGLGTNLAPCLLDTTIQTKTYDNEHLQCTDKLIKSCNLIRATGSKLLNVSKSLSN